MPKIPVSEFKSRRVRGIFDDIQMPRFPVPVATDFKFLNKDSLVGRVAALLTTGDEESERLRDLYVRSGMKSSELPVELNLGISGRMRRLYERAGVDLIEEYERKKKEEGIETPRSDFFKSLLKKYEQWP